jgi:putative two-component system response regulator
MGNRAHGTSQTIADRWSPRVRTRYSGAVSLPHSHLTDARVARTTLAASPPPRAFEDARILIVDDQPANVRLLERLLTANGYTHVTGTSDPRRVLALFEEIRPDLLLLDLHMPHLDGFGVMQALAPSLAAERYVPILVLTADALAHSRQRALSMGARDFLAKPFDPVEAMLRVRNLLEMRFRYLQLERQQRELESRVQDRTRELEDARHEILDRLALAAEYRDDNTGEHTRRVGRVARLIAHAFGLNRQSVDTIARAAALHDVGKVGIPDEILLQPRCLLPHEFDIIKGHTTIGARILSGSRVALLKVAEEVALSHHERWDGRGYPSGLGGEEIPLAARITALADTFDAMTHRRRYAPTFTTEATLAHIATERGGHFDPLLVEAFLDVHNRGALSTASGPDPRHT